MFGKQWRLFSLLGFEGKIDMSWLILAFLITWSLAEGLFPYYYKNLSRPAYWWMGAAGAVGLFLSIIFHELSYSLVARRYGLPMRGITLFIFGGVAEMEDEPRSPRAEFLMAIAGPISSIGLSFIFYGLYRFGLLVDWPMSANGVINYLGWINGLLAAFNMIPAFPLDGGRVLRSGLWKLKNNLRWATRIASRIGAGFGVSLIVLGLLSVLGGNLIGGIWWFLIGMFLHNASNLAYRQMLIRRALEGESVQRFMKADAVTVNPSLSLGQLVEDYFYKYHYKMFPVVENSSRKLVGCVNTQMVREVPRGEWYLHTVGEVVRQCSPENTINPNADAMEVLDTMNRTQQSRLMVVDGENLVGVITLKDMLQFLALKMDLEENDQEFIKSGRDMEQD